MMRMCPPASAGRPEASLQRAGICSGPYILLSCLLPDSRLCRSVLSTSRCSTFAARPIRPWCPSEIIEELTDKLIQRIVELNVDLPLTTLKEKIGDKIAITKFRKEASLMEIQNIFSKHIKNYLEKIENMEL